MQVIDVYPLFDDEGCVVASAKEATIRIATDFHDASLQRAVEQALDGSLPYREAWSRTPFLKNLPAIAKYQRDPDKADVGRVMSELDEHALELPVGQVLLHGGRWPAALAPGIEWVAEEPMSTTLAPEVAAYHGLAGPVCAKQIWVIHIVSRGVRGLAFRQDRSGKLKHEREILLVPNCFFRLKSLSQQQQQFVLEVECWSA